MMLLLSFPKGYSRMLFLLLHEVARGGFFRALSGALRAFFQALRAALASVRGRD
jgi:hypothetical protein